MTDFVHPDDVSGGPTIRSFADYLKFLQMQVATVSWVFREFTTSYTRTKTIHLLIFQLLSTGLNTCGVLMSGLLFAAFIRKDWDAIYLDLMVMATLIIAGVSFSILTGRAKEWVLGLNFCRLDERITELMFEKPLGQHERYGSVLNHSTIEKGKYQTQSMEEVLAFQMTPCGVIILCTLTALWFVDPYVGAIGTVMGIASLLWSMYLNYLVGKFCDPIEREFRRINRVRVEMWEKIARAVTNGLGVKITKQLSKDMEANMARDRSFWIKFIELSELRNFLQSIYLKIILFLIAAWLAYEGKAGVDYLFPILMLSGELIGNLMQFSYAERQLGRSIIPVRLMMEALTITPSFDVHAGEPLRRNGPLSLEFRKVCFNYEDPKEPGRYHAVLRDINLMIAPGEKVALLGESGAGKTTLMKLALRYDDPHSGQILVNGKDLKSLLHSSYMQQTGYIPQHAQILDTTIGENILFGCSEERRAELTANNYEKLWLLMRSLMVDFGERLTQGIHTLVGRHGLNVSGGQGQRVKIAAAIAKDPRLLIIDEATSNLDSVTEEGVQEGLRLALDTNVTALIIAHRLSTVRNMCTRYVVLRPLTEVTEGESQIEAVASSFEELYLISPTFRRLANAQGLRLNAKAA